MDKRAGRDRTVGVGEPQPTHERTRAHDASVTTRRGAGSPRGRGQALARADQPVMNGPTNPGPDANDRQRWASIEACRILDTPRERAFDDLVQIAAEICTTPVATITFIAQHRQWFKAVRGLPFNETPIEQSICWHVVRGTDILEVEDTAGHPQTACNPLVAAPDGLRFYAGAPIKAPDGVAVGVICVADYLPRPGGLTAAQRRTLEALARHVETLLSLRGALRERDQHLAARQELSSALAESFCLDRLTALPNRTLFQAQLEAVIAESRACGTRAAMVLIDLDQFKHINEWLGHDAGDEVLKDFAGLLRKVVRGGDFAARLGSDEFGVILRDVRDDLALDDALRSLAERLHGEVQVKRQTVEHRLSIGIALYPDHAADAVELAQHCDLALREAKARAGSPVMFQAEMSAQHRRHMDLRQQARAALLHNQVVPYYQLKVCLRTGQAVGFEALARNERPGCSAEDPAMFAEAFDHPELNRLMSRRLSEQVFDHMQAWSAVGVPFGHVALNASPHDFADDSFAERLLEQLRRRALPAGALQVEVTESVLLGRGQEPVLRALETLHAAGVQIALDDFGTGYGSLIHLKQFPVHTIKIDRSFVRSIGHSSDDAAIVRAIVGLARSLGIETVAEGIETEAQLRQMTRKGCDLGQGFLFSKAIPAARVPSLAVTGHACAAPAVRTKDG